MKNFGQVEAEAVVAIVLILLFFVAVSVLTFYRNQETEFLQDRADSFDECYRVVGIINYFSSASGREEIFFDSSFDFNVGQETVYVENVSCNFFGDAQTANILAGRVHAFEENNSVVFENA